MTEGFVKSASYGPLKVRYATAICQICCYFVIKKKSVLFCTVAFKFWFLTFQRFLQLQASFLSFKYIFLRRFRSHCVEIYEKFEIYIFVCLLFYWAIDLTKTILLAELIFGFCSLCVLHVDLQKWFLVVKLLPIFLQCTFNLFCLAKTSNKTFGTTSVSKMKSSH